jgi:hypothetical protein
MPPYLRLVTNNPEEPFIEFEPATEEPTEELVNTEQLLEVLAQIANAIETGECRALAVTFLNADLNSTSSIVSPSCYEYPCQTISGLALLQRRFMNDIAPS